MSLTENPFVNMYGPYFLFFYGALLAIFCTLVRRYANSMDKSDLLPPLPVPENPNPYEIAYLRGRDPEVARLMVVELFHRGILVESRKLLQRTKLKLADNVDLDSLDPNLRAVAAAFAQPRSPTPLDSDTIKKAIGPQLDKWSTWVRDEQLTFENEQRRSSTQFGTGMLAVFAATGLYKLIVAIMHGHINVFFLTVLMFVGSIAIMNLAYLPKFTKRGRRYLENLQSAYSSYRQGNLPQPEAYDPASTREAAWDPLLAGSFALPVMAMGLFGASALHSASYRTLRTQYDALSSGASCGSVPTGCGSGCGSSSCSGGGGGCGGGCGGCGGCGG